MSRTEIDCFMCPLTFEVFTDPVVAPSGHSFQREAIETWLADHDSNPFTREPLTVHDLVPNRQLLAAITLWQEMDSEWEARVGALQTQLEAEKRKAARDTGAEHANAAQQNINYFRSIISRSKREEQKRIDEPQDLQRVSAMVPKTYVGEARDAIFAACLYISNNQPTPAIKILKNRIDANPADDCLWVKLGWAFHKQASMLASRELHERSIECYTAALDANPDNAEAYKMWGWALDRLLKYSSFTRQADLIEEAIAHYEQSLDLDPDNADTHNYHGRILREAANVLDDPDEFLERAIQAFEAAEAIEPGHARALCSLGEIHKKRGDFEASQNAFLRAIEHNATDEISHFKLGMSYADEAEHLRDVPRRQDRCFEDALEWFDRCIEVNPDYDAPYAKSGYVLSRLHNYTESRIRYNRALELNANNVVAVRGLKWLDDREFSRPAPRRQYQNRYSGSTWRSPRRDDRAGSSRFFDRDRRDNSRSDRYQPTGGENARPGRSGGPGSWRR